MTEYLELMLLVGFVVSTTGLLITGVAQLALRLESPRSPRATTRRDEARVHRRSA